MMKAKSILFILLIVSITMCTLFFSCRKNTVINTTQIICPTIPLPTNATTELVKTNHYLDTATANTMIANFVSKRNSISNNTLGSQTQVLPYYESFSRRAIQNLLLQDSCIGIKISCGINSSNQVVLILTGISANGTTMIVPNKPLCDTQ